MLAAEGHHALATFAILSARDGSSGTPALATFGPPDPAAQRLWRNQAHGADPRSLGTYGGRGESPLAGSSFSINRARRTRLVWGSQRLDS